MTSPESTRLPHKMSDRFTVPFLRFLRIEAVAGAALFLAAVAALIVSNTAWSEPFHAFWQIPLGLQVGTWAYARPMQDWINDGLMTLFFFIVALELKRELVLGELRHVRIAALSFAGALGGMLVPAAIYLMMMLGRTGIHGWGSVMPTDTAFVIGCLALLGTRIPPTLRLFLLSLAIFDDIGAIIVTTVGYGHALHVMPLVLGIGGLTAIAGVSWLGVKSMSIYVLAGCAIWFCIDASGIHPTFTGVALGLMTPTGAWVKDARLRAILERILTHETGEHWSGDTNGRRDLRIARTAVTEALSPVERLEIVLHPWVAFVIMPIFALANAGVTLSGVDTWQPVSTAILAALVIGKPVGVMAFTWIAVRLGLARQTAGLHWPLLAAGSLLTGIGFTMSLFIAEQAYPPDLLDAAKIGILGASTLSAAIGLVFLVRHGFKNRNE
ncbi:Na+/H+ antiporter NhaA [Oleiagrimonas sp. MCCC 1A03011]|nr:Na+/H+ antiporter NhaA [Oleiagrimonas sp. MCCC 1A03011]